jgi:hypothetical protein
MSTPTPVPLPDERQPLLADVVDEENNSQDADVSEQKPLSRLKRLGLYGILILLLVTIGLFIKAFIDSGDVHVS